MEKKKTPIVEDLNEQLKKVEGSDKRLACAIAYLEGTLANDKKPEFKKFWGAREICVEIMKENISPLYRGQMWEKLGELTLQARRLKDLFVEESSFTEEQFLLAVSGLEEELASLPQELNKNQSYQLEEKPYFLRNHITMYEKLQRELNFLLAYADRVTSLRKDLVKTSMRLSHKNKLFDRLSKCGDKVFPVKKELINTLSELFDKDIDDFLQKKVALLDTKSVTHSTLKDIKELQRFAKKITLNAQIFHKTRESLSEAWKKVQVIKDEQMIEAKKKYEESKEKAAPFFQQIHELTENFKKEGEETKLGSYKSKVEEFLRTIEKENFEKTLKNELQIALKEIQTLIDLKENEEREKIKKMQLLALEKHQKLAAELKEKVKSCELDREKVTVLQKQVKETQLPLNLKKSVLAEFEPIFDQLLVKEHEGAKSGDDVKTFLLRCKERRNQVKKEFESMRRQLGGSGLDFAEQLETQEKMQQLKKQLEEMDQRIHSVEKH